VWVVRRACRVEIVAGDVESREVEADIVISPLADEPLMSDMLARRLEPRRL